MKNPHASPSRPLAFRQIHLDFHTQGDIAGVARAFSKRAFQDALKRGHVDSVTLFSKCHHGWSYHPTKAGVMHPHLKTDLLSRQIEACEEIGVRYRIYVSAGVDERLAVAHPEWVVKQRDGSTYDPLSAVWFKFLRFNSPYLDVLCAQIEEVVRRWPGSEGLFLDIISPQLDYAEPTLRDMLAAGLDPEKPADVATHAQRVLAHYHERTNAAALVGPNKKQLVFHNAGHVPVGAEKFIRYNGHLELESLPTGGWGYDHFAVSARYAITTGMDYLGMTGKFHTTWGEFGGFKRPAALRYECAAMLAYGAKCSIGDQLHPDGAMNPDTYDLIGAAYAEVESKEPWAHHVTPVARIALVSAERDQARARGHLTVSRADEGAARMLMEAHLPFVVLDENTDWRGYDLVVLPEGFALTPGALKKARAHLKRGGRLLAAGDALFTADHSAFAVDFGATLLGRSPAEPDYLLATPLSASVPVRTPIVIHGGAWEAEPKGAKIFAERRVPYFNRTWKHFCSHQHAPDSPKPATPAALAGNGIVWFAHDIFTRYATYGQPLYRDFVISAVRHLLDQKLPVETTLPTDGRFNLLEQTAEKRYVAHLLYAPKSLRGSTMIAGQGTLRPIEIIEDLVPLRDVTVKLRVPRHIRSAKLVPGGTTLPFTQTNGQVSFTVPEFTAHQMVELAW